MNHMEIADKLVELHFALVAKLGGQPKISPSMTIHSSGSVSIGMYNSDNWECKTIFGDGFKKCLENAFQHVADLPTPESRTMHVYMGMLAKAVDYAHENNIDDEYVDPARITIKAMTDNLLTSQVLE